MTLSTAIKVSPTSTKKSIAFLTASETCVIKLEYRYNNSVGFATITGARVSCDKSTISTLLTDPRYKYWPNSYMECSSSFMAGHTRHGETVEGGTNLEKNHFGRLRQVVYAVLVYFRDFDNLASRSEGTISIGIKPWALRLFSWV
jgi:hypothetical protein